MINSRFERALVFFWPPDIINFHLKCLFVITLLQSRRNIHTFDCFGRNGTDTFHHSTSKCHLTSYWSCHSLLLAWNANENPSSETVNLSWPRRSLGRFRLKFMRLTCGKSKVEQQVILQEHKFYINRHEYICLLWCIIRIFLSSITTDETVPSGPCGSAVVPEYAYLQTHLIQVQSFICLKAFLPSVINFTL